MKHAEDCVVTDLPNIFWQLCFLPLCLEFTDHFQKAGFINTVGLAALQKRDNSWAISPSSKPSFEASASLELLKLTPELPWLKNGQRRGEHSVAAPQNRSHGASSSPAVPPNLSLRPNSLLYLFLIFAMWVFIMLAIREIIIEGDNWAHKSVNPFTGPSPPWSPSEPLTSHKHAETRAMFPWLLHQLLIKRKTLTLFSLPHRVSGGKCRAKRQHPQLFKVGRLLKWQRQHLF